MLCWTIFFPISSRIALVNQRLCCSSLRCHYYMKQLNIYLCSIREIAVLQNVNYGQFFSSYSLRWPAHALSQLSQHTALASSRWVHTWLVTSAVKKQLGSGFRSRHLIQHNYPPVWKTMSRAVPCLYTALVKGREKSRDSVFFSQLCYFSDWSRMGRCLPYLLHVIVTPETRTT